MRVRRATTASRERRPRLLVPWELTILSCVRSLKTPVSSVQPVRKTCSGKQSRTRRMQSGGIPEGGAAALDAFFFCLGSSFFSVRSLLPQRRHDWSRRIYGVSSRSLLLGGLFCPVALSAGFLQFGSGVLFARGMQKLSR